MNGSIKIELEGDACDVASEIIDHMMASLVEIDQRLQSIEDLLRKERHRHEQ